MSRLAFALWIGLAPGSDSFDDLVQQARDHFEAQRYGEAAAALEQAHAQTPDDDVLFNWANAERLAGKCDRAVELYDRYLEHQGAREELDELSVRYVDVARERRDECAEAEVPAPPVPAPVDPPEPEPDEPDEPAVVDEPVEEPAGDPTGSDESKPDEISSPPRRPAPDAWGWATTGVGITAFGAGTTMVAVAYARDANATDQPSHGAYLERVAQSGRLSVAGWFVMGVGVAALVSGAARLAVVRKRARSSARASVGLGSVTVRF